MWPTHFSPLSSPRKLAQESMADIAAQGPTSRPKRRPPPGGGAGATAMISPAAAFAPLRARIRILEGAGGHYYMMDDAYGCAPPPPRIVSHFSSTTNETVSIEAEVRVHEIGILFDYEVRHASGVEWEESSGEDSDGGGDSFFGKAGKFFGGLFGGGDDNEEEEQDNAPGGGAGALLDLERFMAAETWDSMLGDAAMTWAEGESGKRECAGLTIEGGEGLRRLDGAPLELAVDSEGGGDDEEGGAGAEEEEEEEASDGEEAGEGEEPHEGEEPQEGGDTLDALDTAATFSGTKLLGLTHQPLDYVDHAGCAVPDKTCTSVRGQISVAYAGGDEYGVVQAVVGRLRDGMGDGSFLPSGGPALNLDFVGAGGTTPVAGGGATIISGAARGTGMGTEVAGQEEDPLSRYGVLFVCLVAVLGAGLIVALTARYRKRKSRRRQAVRRGLCTEEEHLAHLALREAVVEDVTMDHTVKTDGYQTSISEQGTPGSAGIIDQVELEVSPANSGNSDEVEISLSGSKSWGAQDPEK